jgi:hypothetical protein
LDYELNLISKVEFPDSNRGVSVVENNLIIVGSSNISVYDINNNYSRLFTKNLISSSGITIDTDRNILKADYYNNNLFLFNKGYLFYTKADDYTNTKEFNLPTSIESIDISDDGNSFFCCTKDEYIEYKNKIV